MKNLINLSYFRIVLEVIGTSTLCFFNHHVVIFDFIFPVFLVSIFLSHLLPLIFDKNEQEENLRMKEKKYPTDFCVLFIFLIAFFGFSLMTYIVFSLFRASIHGYFLIHLSFFSFFNGITLLFLLFLLFLRKNDYIILIGYIANIIKILIALMMFASMLIAFYIFHILIGGYQGGFVYQIGNMLGIIFILASYYFEITDIGKRLVNRTESR